MKKSTPYIVLLFVILFFTFDAFGLKPEDLGRYKGSVYGVFSLLSVGVTLLSCLLIPKKYVLYKNVVGRLTLYLSLLIAMIIIQFVFQLMTGQTTASSIVNLLTFKSFAMPFFIVYICSRIGFRSLWRSLRIAALICSVISMVVVLFGVEGTSIIVSRKALATTGDFRTIIPSSAFIAFGFIAYFSEYLQKHNPIVLLASIICFGACFIQLHRSVIISLLIIVALCVVLNMKLRINNMLSVLVVLALLVVGTGILLRSTNYSLASIIDVFQATALNFSTVGDSSASLRFLMLMNAIVFVASNRGMGIGLTWQSFDQLEYVMEAFTQSPSYDSGYYNVIILFGFVGLAVFLWTFVTLFRKLHYLRKRVKSKNGSIFVNTMILSLLYTVLTSFAGDFLVLEYSATFYITIALLHILLVGYEGKSKQV